MNRILIIDDDPMLRETVRLLLEHEGFAVLEAPDGPAGAAMARSHLPDLILCDINMQGRKDAGFDTLARLREDPATATIPFILMTGNADAAGMRLGMGLGADDYLAKPFQADALYATVNARLRKTQTVRNEAEKRLSHLRSQISLMMPHEMRTPLNGIVSNAELLAASPENFDPPAIAEMSRDICLSARRLERLIENFLICAQLEAAGTDTVIIPSKSPRAAEIVRDAASRIAADNGRSGDLILNLAETSPAISEVYFHKIVTELVMNAFKFSAEKSPVHVSLASRNNQVEFCVADRGRGFAPGQIRSIGAYFQFDRKADSQEGLGLGLAITRKLVELHRGAFTVSSNPGQETRISILLPAAV